MTLSTEEGKEVGSMRIASIQKARARIMSIPRGRNVVWHLNVADLLNLAVLQSVPIRRNDEFKVEADHTTMNADVRACQSVFIFCHLPIPLYSHKLMLYIC